LSVVRRARSIAVVDGGSFVLPYDFQLVQALAGQGLDVHFYGSRTRYNGEFLEAMRDTPGVTVHAAGVSGTVAPRWKGASAYVGLLLQVLRARHDVVNLQFSAWWPPELPLLWPLRQQLVYTVHNAVPHGHAGQQHAPTRWLASMARSLVFVSEATHDDFMRRYGERFRAKSQVLPHGLLPVAPGLGATPFQAEARARSLVFWGTVKPYKGVELFAELARSARIRALGLTLEVCGAWDASLAPLRRELADLGVVIHDRYLDHAELQALLARDAVFLLPYRDASQSGALYSLLNHGRPFICADTGDLGAFMRRHGLEPLLLRERSADAVADSLEYLQAHHETVMQAFQRAQQASRWERLIAEHGRAYGLGSGN
jgi:glycosyltransferase involved in cell wall biosynthesis